MQAGTAFAINADATHSPETTAMSRQASPLPALSTSTPTSHSGTESSASNDPMYSNLPTYRFPAGPADGILNARSKPPPERQQLLRFPTGVKLPEAPPPEPIYEPLVAQTQAMGFSSGPPLRSATYPQVGGQPSLKPALPILNYPDAHFPSYEPENVYPSGMVTEADNGHYAPQAPHNYTFGSHNNTQWRPRSDIGGDAMLPQTPQVQQNSIYLSPTKIDVQYSPMSTPSTTYMPTSAYLPSSAAFAGLSPNFGHSSARSAPSTPQGRQDARFIGEKGWGVAAPGLQYSDHVAPHTEPRLRVGMPGTPDLYASHSSYNSNLGLGYQSADDYENDASPTTNSITFFPGSNRTNQSPYIPYARPSKLSSSQNKRSTTFPVDLGASMKKPKRNEALYSSTSSLNYSSDTALMDARSKQQRCKIACSACRKTRLKCDGGVPCTSCIDKHLKTHPGRSEADASSFIQEEHSCVYESFIRRRGKGKKTLEKERQEVNIHQQDQDRRSASSEYSGLMLSSTS